MRPIGFSTGAIALGDFRTALRLLVNTSTTAVELSALREHELEPLMDAIANNLQMIDRFDHVSIHAPSKLHRLSEREVIALLDPAKQRGWPIVVHPNVLDDDAAWKGLGAQLCIENMDQSKCIGRTAEELDELFGRFSEASFCFDIGHAHQIDPTMSQALRILEHHADRIAQLHVSQVDAQCQHVEMSKIVSRTFRRVADLVPATCPAIIESRLQFDPTDPECMNWIAGEVRLVLEALAPTCTAIAA